MTSLRSTFMLILLLASVASAQQPQRGNPPTTPPGQPPGGRGGGRGAIATMTLTTSAWTDGGQIPAKYSQAGEQLSPPLAWSSVPEGINSFVLIVHDVDAAAGTG